MKSLGKKSGGGEISTKTSEKEIHYPSVTMTEDIMPDLKGKEIGSKVMMMVECEICSISKYGNGEIEYRMDMKKAGMKGDTKKEDEK